MKGEKAELAVFIGLWGIVAIVIVGIMAVASGEQAGRPMSAFEADSMQKQLGRDDPLVPIAVSYTGSWRIAATQEPWRNQAWRSLEITTMKGGRDGFYLAKTDVGANWIIKAKSDEQLHWAIGWMVNQKSEGGSGK